MDDSVTTTILFSHQLISPVDTKLNKHLTDRSIWSYPIIDIYTIAVSAIAVTLILVSGYAQDPETGDMFHGPCYVPPKVNVLNLLVSMCCSVNTGDSWING